MVLNSLSKLTGMFLLAGAVPVAAEHLTPLVDACHSGKQRACADLYDRARYECQNRGNRMSCDIQRQMDAQMEEQPGSPTGGQQDIEAAGQACVVGDMQACGYILSALGQACDAGIYRACDTADQLASALAIRDGRGQQPRVPAPGDFVGQPTQDGEAINEVLRQREEQLCVVYPERCTMYDQDRPSWSPYDAVPAGPGAIANALDGLPPTIRRELYPPEVADAVRNGTIDRAIEDSLGRSFDPYAEVITGTGRGGSFYTDDAARDTYSGRLTPECAAIQAMGLSC